MNAHVDPADLVSWWAVEAVDGFTAAALDDETVEQLVASTMPTPLTDRHARRAS